MDSSSTSPSRTAAATFDSLDELAHLRAEFHIPTKAQMLSTVLIPPVRDQREPDGTADAAVAASGSKDVGDSSPVTYLVGNSLGLQPRRTWDRVRLQLDFWASRGVTGHFSSVDTTVTASPSSSSSEISPTPKTIPWVDLDAYAANLMAPIVGADETEVAVMQTLSANLHLLLCRFYRPDRERVGRHEILIEEKAFPSDHFIVESQIQTQGLPLSSLVLLRPDASSRLLSTASILSTLDAHAATAAILLLPGVQYYTGQLLDMPAITAHAQRLGIIVIWDLAHAVGNVELQLHEWNVDGAAWCGYKYLNGGPGCIGGLFLHQRHHHLPEPTGSAVPNSQPQVPGLKGWWGTMKQSRFEMNTGWFVPSVGAAAMQLSNPSVLCTTALCASLEVVRDAGGIKALRSKSRSLTEFLYRLLEELRSKNLHQPLFEIITPRDPDQRGAQLSILLLRDGILDTVMERLTAHGVCVDQRRPDVIRVAPAPLYNTYRDCCVFVEALEQALSGVEK